MSAKSLPLEVVFAQKLASNTPKVRDRAVKKLASWFSAKAKSTSGFSDLEMQRIWKGLLYCYWMSDKPLVQEELAEKISSMIQIFHDYPKTAEQFIKHAFIALGKEWNGIDVFRIDKFMMLVRRFLRKVFSYADHHEWSVVENLVQLINDHVVRANNSIKEPVVSLGFQLHFTDVFLEELAKVGGENLEDPHIRLFLKPFITEMQFGGEKRFLEHIKERIFRHLMRQSDIGIAYEEGNEEEMLDEDDEMNDVDDELEDKEVLENGEDADDNEWNESTAQDPRAGKVDVTIPQLMVDYEKLAEDLFKAGGDPKVSKINRKYLFSLTKEFKALALGKYPLAPDFELDDTEEPKMKKMKNAIKEAAREALKEKERIAKERQEYRKILKKKAKQNASSEVESLHPDTIDEEAASADESESKNEPEESQGRNGKEKKAKKRKASSNETGEKPMKKKSKATSKNDLVSVDSNGESDKPTKEKKTKKIKKEDVLSNNETSVITSTHITEEEIASNPQESQSKKKKKKKKESAILSKSSNTEKIKATENEEASMEVSDAGEGDADKSMKSNKNKKNKKKKKKNESFSSTSFDLGDEDNWENDFETEQTPKEDNSSINVNVVSDDDKETKDEIGIDTSIEKKMKKKKRISTEMNDSFPTKGITGYEPPSIKNTPSPKTTPMFLKKALSKSEKKKVSKKAFESPSPSKNNKVPQSEPRPNSKKKRKINFSLTQNKYQSWIEHTTSISESPDIPYRPDLKPKQGVLRIKEDISVVKTPSPRFANKLVQRNTAINSKTKTNQIFNRMMASDFF